MQTSFNSLEFKLKQQYQERIVYLQSKIKQQEHEIAQLQQQIKYTSKDKFYDC